MDSDTAAHRKRALRAELRERRQNLTSTERQAATAGLTRRVATTSTVRDTPRTDRCA